MQKLVARLTRDGSNGYGCGPPEGLFRMSRKLEIPVVIRNDTKESEHNHARPAVALCAWSIEGRGVRCAKRDEKCCDDTEYGGEI